MPMEYFRRPTDISSPEYTWNGAQMRQVMCSEEARAFMGAYNQAVAQDPMAVRSQFLTGVGIPEAKGR
jgi:hypothetical protein